MILECGYLRNSTLDSRFWLQKVLFTLQNQAWSTSQSELIKECLVQESPLLTQNQRYFMAASPTLQVPNTKFTLWRANSCQESDFLAPCKAMSSSHGCLGWCSSRVTPESAGRCEGPTEPLPSFSHSWYGSCSAQLKIEPSGREL